MECDEKERDETNSTKLMKCRGTGWIGRTRETRANGRILVFTPHLNAHLLREHARLVVFLLSQVLIMMMAMQTHSISRSSARCTMLSVHGRVAPPSRTIPLGQHPIQHVDSQRGDRCPSIERRARTMVHQCQPCKVIQHAHLTT